MKQPSIVLKHPLNHRASDQDNISAGFREAATRFCLMLRDTARARHIGVSRRGGRNAALAEIQIDSHKHRRLIQFQMLGSGKCYCSVRDMYPVVDERQSAAPLQAIHTPLQIPYTSIP